jgi:phage-related minor tail protein
LAQTVIGAVVEAIKGFVRGLVDATDNALGPLDEIIGKGVELIGGAAGAVANFVTGKASGGPVDGGRTYLVGEKGPELFTPRTTGTIIPNNALGGVAGGASNYTITVVNPVAEPTSTSIPTALRRAAQLRG